MTTETSKTIVTSAYAVWRRSSSSTSAVHSERIAAGTWGRNAPAPNAQSARTQEGASRPAATTQRDEHQGVRRRHPAQHGAAGRSGPSAGPARPRRARWRPRTRPRRGPRRANDPCASRTSRRIARPYIPIGIDPATEATSGTRAAGSDEQRAVALRARAHRARRLGHPSSDEVAEEAVDALGHRAQHVERRRRGGRGAGGCGRGPRGGRSRAGRCRRARPGPTSRRRSRP